MKPLIFLGTNSVLDRFIEACERQQQAIAGIIDSDWFGNRESFAGLPILDTQTVFDTDPTKYQDYVFFIGTNFHPDGGRDIAKRRMLIDIVRQHNLSCINLIDPLSQVSRFATLGSGIFVGAHVIIEPQAVVSDFVTAWGQNTIGHRCHLGENTVIQRGASLDAITGHDVYVGMGSWVMADDAVIVGDNAVVDPSLHVARDVEPNERVQLDRNFVRVYRARKPSTN
jgi:acetyltransferase-like isoleucine patch superfamily enzyme